MRPRRAPSIVSIGLLFWCMLSGCDSGRNGTVLSPVFQLALCHVLGGGSLAFAASQAVATNDTIMAAGENRAVTSNRPPQLHPLADVTAINTAREKTVVLTASDPDGGKLTYTVSNNSDPAVVKAFVQRQSVVLRFKTPGTAVITVRVTDPQGAFAEASFTVTIRNRRPRLQSLADVTAVNTAPEKTVALMASDPDGDKLIYTVSNNSDPTVVKAIVRDQSLILNFKTPGAAIITVRVTDPQGAFAEVSFTVTVPNRRPQLQPLANITTVNTASNKTVILAASDPDGGRLTYSIGDNSNPDVVGTIVHNQTLILNFKTPGTATISVHATDRHGAFDRTTFTVTVRNRRPRLQPLGNLVAIESDRDRTIALTATDADGDTLTYTIRANTHPAVVRTSLQGQVLALDFNAPGTASITIRVTDPHGDFDDDTFTMTVKPHPIPPVVNNIPDQQSMVGDTGIDLPLSVRHCADCVFAVFNLPPNLNVDKTTQRIVGKIAYTAFATTDYGITITAKDRTTGLSSLPIFFNWRITPDPVTALVDPNTGESGDGDGDGDSSDGDGGADGDAGDGGDASPLVGATCRLVNLDGSFFLDGTGNPIETTTNDQGKFRLRIPHDVQNPDFVVAMEGFIECFDAQKEKLLLSRYVNTRGLGRGERLTNLTVNPTTTVIRQMHDSLNDATLKMHQGSPTRTVDVVPDLVAIQAQFLKDITGLQTQSPLAVREEENNAPTCGIGTITVVRDIDIPLQAPPSNPKGRRSGIAAYVASQLFLAAFKGEKAVPGGPLNRFCPGEQLGDGSGKEFSQVMYQYFANRTVTPQELLDLGIQKDDGIITGATGPGGSSCD